ncbi:hypothetical protein NDU88_003124 [Pleurodeles waltl]|uniref:Uncharacterized protein n=1 Tax=Pleurodeles waltl TaxID=8319 RepID=A0AAV7NIB7_PLEWA|nr:hypothetical protein NDU88_003124 [Pleurodeles waltl]
MSTIPRAPPAPRVTMPQSPQQLIPSKPQRRGQSATSRQVEPSTRAGRSPRGGKHPPLMQIAAPGRSRCSAVSPCHPARCRNHCRSPPPLISGRRRQASATGRHRHHRQGENIRRAPQDQVRMSPGIGSSLGARPAGHVAWPRPLQ